MTLQHATQAKQGTYKSFSKEAVGAANNWAIIVTIAKEWPQMKFVIQNHFQLSELYFNDATLQ